MRRTNPQQDAPHLRKQASGPRTSLRNGLLLLILAPSLLACLVMISSFAMTLDTQSGGDLQHFQKLESHAAQLGAPSAPRATEVIRPARGSSGYGLGDILKDINYDNIQLNPLSDSKSVHYEIIFSTGCTTYQDWQSFLVFYFAQKSGQPGNVTRIVSGCSEEDKAKLQTVFDEKVRPLSPNFYLHFTPDFSSIVKPGKSYKYFNKPYGTRHWLEQAQSFPEAPLDPNAIVVLLDPDQIILSPFENNDFTNTTWKFIDKHEKPRILIEHGQPMAQLYGFGLQWLDKVDIDYVTGTPDSPIKTMDRKDAQKGYIVGPPYIATAADMYKISTTWSDFAPRVHDQYPYLLAEMFAYSLAAAHLQLSHQTAASFMISSPGIHQGEGWEYIMNIPDQEICQYPPSKTRMLPNVMHFCQRYGWGPYFFGKYRQPGDFLSCDHPLFQLPPSDLLQRYTYQQFPDKSARKILKPKEAKEHAYSVCLMINALNDAASHYKDHHCDASANHNATLMFVQEPLPRRP